MISFGSHTQVYLAAGHTDMRCGINALAALVVDVLEHDPLSSHVFVFCNRRKDKLKILFWQRNGFWLWYRRLERQRFWWPPAGEDFQSLIPRRWDAWRSRFTGWRRTASRRPLRRPRRSSPNGV